MTRAIFEIINGDTTVNMLSKGGGICIQSWIPARMQMKDGGIFTESPLSDGRQLADYHWTNWTETITFASRSTSTDRLITQYARKLDELFIKGLDYWTKPTQSTPTYLKVKAKNETNARYAVIKGVVFPDDANPFTSPFFSSLCKSAKSEIEVQIEHSGWFSEPPDSSTCVQVSGDFPYGTDTAEFSPAASTDDATADNTGGTLDTSLEYLTMSDTDDIGIRFTNVTIPQGSTINSAKIFLTALNTVDQSQSFRIYGHDVDNSSTFSNYADFTGRVITAASKVWEVVQIQNLVRTETPDISEIIQEIVDRAGWSSGNALSILVFYLNGEGEKLWASYDYLSGVHKAVLQIEYQDGSLRGQEATCEPQVFVSNRETRAPLTHIYNYDDSLGTFSGNLVNDTTVSIFPAAGVALDDIIYFGCQFGTVFDEGPFTSLVFDIDTAMAGTYTITWEYWDGGSWSALSVTDNTQSFQNVGVHSVHWIPPSDWATTVAPNQVNTIIALFVRVRVSAFTSVTSQASTQNRVIYTINWPKLQVGSAQIGGDLPAYIEMVCRGVSGTIGSEILDASGFYVGVRSVDRGPDFQCFINVNSDHNVSGVGIGATSGLSTITPISPSGQRHATAVTTSPEKALYISFSSDIVDQYKGDYAVFVRTLSDFNGYMSLSLEDTPDDDIVVGDVVITAQNSSSDLAYSAMGRISIPGVPCRLNIWLIDEIDITLTDIILLPVDEFAAHVYYANADKSALPITEIGTTPATLTFGNQNLTDMNEWVIARLNQNSNLALLADYVAEVNSPAHLLPNRDQNIYFLFTQDDTVADTSQNITTDHDGTIWVETDSYTGSNVADDASTNSAAGTIALNNAAEDFGSAGKYGVIFRTVAIPQGALIRDAKLTFTAAANATPASTFITGIDEDNTTAPFTTFADMDGRARTDEFVSWTARAWVNGNSYETPSLRKIVQEIVDRPGWGSGNNMGFIFSEGAAAQTFDSFDSATGLTAISLDITYLKFNNTDPTAEFGGSLGRFGVQFPGVNIPRGATIESASVSFEASNPAGTALLDDVLITGEDDGDPSGGGYTDFENLEGRVRTSAAVVWSPTVWVDGTRYDTPDLSEIVKEIISRDDWEYGNWMSFIFSGGTDTQIIKTVNQALAVDKPEFDVTFTVRHNEARQEITQTITLSKNQRYTSMRGDT